MSTIHVHIHSSDSFDESKHPRANNGQFGAGEGKSHAEHAAHHSKMADLHLKASNAARAKNKHEDMQAHSVAYSRHVTAYADHKDAESQKGKFVALAHISSKVAYDASGVATKHVKVK